MGCLGSRENKLGVVINKVEKKIAVHLPEISEIKTVSFLTLK